MSDSVVNVPEQELICKHKEEISKVKLQLNNKINDLITELDAERNEKEEI